MRGWITAHDAANTSIEGVDVNDFAEWVARRSELTRDDVPSDGW